MTVSNQMIMYRKGSKFCILVDDKELEFDSIHVLFTKAAGFHLQ